MCVFIGFVVVTMESKPSAVKCIYSVIQSLSFLSQPAEKSFAFNLGCWVCSKSKNEKQQF